MHAVRRDVLEAQAESLGLPMHVVEIPAPCPNEVYEAQMSTALRSAYAERVRAVVFGDLFLADVRATRGACRGRTRDESSTQHCWPDLPPDVDPCGENGEFHTFG